MEIRVHTDNHINGSQNLAEKYGAFIKDKLERFSEYLTTVEVFLGDENSSKPGTDDKRCTIEARPRNLNPEAVTHHADTLDHALNGAVDKIRNLLDSRIGKLQNK
ncbi:MAG: HPF/RaiA family ribosome-associated protein [Niabella sp.]